MMTMWTLSLFFWSKRRICVMMSNEYHNESAITTTRTSNIKTTKKNKIKNNKSHCAESGLRLWTTKGRSNNSIVVVD